MFACMLNMIESKLNNRKPQNIDPCTIKLTYTCRLENLELRKNVIVWDGMDGLALHAVDLGIGPRVKTGI